MFGSRELFFKIPVFWNLIDGDGVAGVVIGIGDDIVIFLLLLFNKLWLDAIIRLSFWSTPFKQFGFQLGIL
jgi:hypothetical protein